MLIAEIAVQKRSGAFEDFDLEKIKKSVRKACSDAGQVASSDLVDTVASSVVLSVEASSADWISVEDLDDLVEQSLFEAEEFDVARLYIVYRHKTKPNVFRARKELYPMEYPEILDFVDAIRRAYWVHTEFNVAGDIAVLKRAPFYKREALLRIFLVIAQVEVAAVKSFWRKVGDFLPKPEIDMAGTTMAESEVRHFDAYQFLITEMGLQERFETLRNEPVINKRVAYLEAALAPVNTPEEYFKKIILFTLFIESVSLMHAFLAVTAVHKANPSEFENISNIVEATSKEEDIHARLGYALANIIIRENKFWMDEKLIKEVIERAHKAIESECEIIDWMFEHGELEEIPKTYLKEFIKHRMNMGLKAININYKFPVDAEILDKVSWFEVELYATKSFDRFARRGTGYNKRAISITADDF